MMGYRKACVSKTSDGSWCQPDERLTQTQQKKHCFVFLDSDNNIHVCRRQQDPDFAAARGHLSHLPVRQAAQVMLTHLGFYHRKSNFQKSLPFRVKTVLIYSPHLTCFSL